MPLRGRRDDWEGPEPLSGLLRLTVALSEMTCLIERIFRGMMSTAPVFSLKSSPLTAVSLEARTRLQDHFAPTVRVKIPKIFRHGNQNTPSPLEDLKLILHHRLAMF